LGTGIYRGDIVMAFTFTEGKLVWDRFLYYPSMGMCWDLRTIKRTGTENEFANAVQLLNEQIAENPKHQAWFATLFLRDNQVIDLSAITQASFHAKTYLMLAMPTFTGVTMPSIGVWNPCHFVWINNQKVLFELYQGSKEATINWLAYRYQGWSLADVEDYASKAPKGSLSLKDAVKPPVVVTPPPDNGGDTDVPPVVTGDGFVHVRCPYCLKTIF
jgi:hypothetical protein